MKPIIGIIGKSIKDSDGYSVLGCYNNLRKGIIESGGVPILLLPPQDMDYEKIRPIDTPKLTQIEKDDLKAQLCLCDGLVLSGGDKLFEYDDYIYKKALELDMPILGICGGMQLMCLSNVSNDNKNIHGEIVKNITKINHFRRNEKYVHKVLINDNTKLKEIIGNNVINVNSVHNYHLTTSKDMVISALSEDGLIEAVEYSDKLFVVGVQWHPETMIEYDAYQYKLFNAFIDKCVAYKNKRIF